MRWTTTKESHAYMQERQEQNKKRSRHNRNELWMMEKLKATGRKWTRQAQWGYRLFDFWNHELGVAVEVDGPEHDQIYDRLRDEHNYRVSSIVVLRVRNGNEDDAQRALNYIDLASSWNARRLENRQDPIAM